MTAGIFAVLRTRGPAWNDALAMEQQVDWRAHADFVNGLAAEGFARLVGPLTGTRDVLLIVRAESQVEVEVRLAEDCWTANGLLRTLWIRPWELRLGALALDLKGADNHVPGALLREAPSCSSRNAS